MLRPHLARALAFATPFALLAAAPSSAQGLPGSVDYDPPRPPDVAWPLFVDASAAVSGAGTEFADPGVGRGQAFVDIVGPDPAAPSDPARVGPPDGILDFVQANSNSPGLPLGVPASQQVTPPIGSEPSPCRVFRGAADGSFTDVTAAMLVGSGTGFDILHPGGSPWGVAAGDHDGDGDVDLVFPCGGFNTASPNALLGNRGDGRFEYLSPAAGLTHVQASFCATWFDHDLDGDLDLHVANSTDTVPALFQGPSPDPVDRLYRNDGDGTFVDVAPQAGVDLRSTSFTGSVADLDLDGRQDLFVACFRQYDKVFYANGDGTFSFMAPAANPQVNVTLASLVPDPAYPGALEFGAVPPLFADALPMLGWSSLPVDTADMNGDGWPDIVVGTWSSQLWDPNTMGAVGALFDPGEPQRIYLNRGDQDGDGLGDGFFREVGAEVGFDHVGGSMGLTLGDFNADGFVDVYCGNGGPFVNFQLEEDLLYVNNGPSWPADFQADPDQPLAKVFWEVGALSGTYANLFMGHGVVQRPVREDGRIDVVLGNGGPAVFNEGQTNVYWRNTGSSDGRPARTLLVDVAAASGAPGAFGTRVGVLRASPGGTAHLGAAERKATIGFATTSHAPLAFGLGTEDALYLTVRWPSGTEEGRFLLPGAPRELALAEGTLSIGAAAGPAPGGGELLRVELVQRGATPLTGDLVVRRVRELPVEPGASLVLPAGSGAGTGGGATPAPAPPLLPPRSAAPSAADPFTADVFGGWLQEPAAVVAAGLVLAPDVPVEAVHGVGAEATPALYRFLLIDPSTGGVLAETGLWRGGATAFASSASPVAPGGGPALVPAAGADWTDGLRATDAMPSAPRGQVVVRASLTVAAGRAFEMPARVPLEPRELECVAERELASGGRLRWTGGELRYEASDRDGAVLSFRDGELVLALGGPGGCCDLDVGFEGRLVRLDAPVGPVVVDGVRYSIRGERLGP